ncbi:UpxZ family transcription anti-terminator antagonist [Bacteroides sp.]|uniref:UpxZ family transcription anti-terminator antagonist n=1 Tax=Bacteroides sp. TaxID=29523 RepID=UPI002608707C|nr:UpxZ family transcription anti-terminator antagonist [Bacteroides sp.]MDD3037290.1 UpxZ family transcription anti-terminator antagonist [Bacteroides sp.]
MDTAVLQIKIENLLSSVHRLLPVGSDMSDVYSDDFSELNHTIYHQINELYPRRGITLEQDAVLCLALLLGYSVSMYASLEDESKKHNILVRSRSILQTLSASPLKERLLTVCQELTGSFKTIDNF